MNPDEDYLIKEYIQSIQTGQFLEQSIERHFKNLSVVFVWTIILFGYLLRNSLTSKDVWESLITYNARELIVIPGVLFLLYSYVCIINMLKTRSADVQVTSRANFIRGYLLRDMPVEFCKLYFDHPRLMDINTSDIYGRPAWSFTSDVALYVILTGFMSTVEFGIVLRSFIYVSVLYFIPILVLHLLAVIIFSRLWLRKQIPPRNQK